VEVIERATHKNALFRYKSAQAFWRAVESAAGPGGVPRRPDAELAALLAHHRAAGGSAPTPGGVTVLASPSDRLPAHTYPEMISQLAEAKRKVKPARPVGLDAGCDFVPQPQDPGAAPFAAVAGSPFAPPTPDPAPVAAPAIAPPVPVAPSPAAPSPAGPSSPKPDVVVLERKPLQAAPLAAAVAPDHAVRASATPPATPSADSGGSSPHSRAVALVLITLLVCGSSVVLAQLLDGWPAAVGVAALAAMAAFFGYLLARG
jgi:hypothetical protein